MEESNLVSIKDDSSKVVKVGSNLCEKNYHHLISFLRANADIFAWSASDLSGIDPEVMVHQLNVI